MDEPILEGRLAARGSGLGLAPVIPVGMRAVTVRVNDVTGIAGFVLPGMRVDVLVTGNPPAGSGTVTVTPLQNMVVLSAGTVMQPDTKGQAIQAATVTLLATPEQAETADARQQRGAHSVGAAERQRSERRKDSRAAKWPNFTAERASQKKPEPSEAPARGRRPRAVETVVVAAPPPPPPPPPDQIIVIRGTQKTVEVRRSRGKVNHDQTVQFRCQRC